MRALLVHNYYQQRGGEDHVFDTEARLLESGGHSVDRYTVHNDTVREMSPLRLARKTLWNESTYVEVQRRVKSFRPDVVHVHNSFPILSAAVHHAASSAGAPVIQTLHNYRLYCPGATFFRDGRICEACGSRRVPWPGVVHGCYRGSRLASAVTASALVLHRILDTWTRKVDLHIVLSEFSRRKFIECGLPSEMLRVKPNAIFPEPGPATVKGNYGIFVGRLSLEKGVRTLLEALRLLAGRVPFRIVGGGPLEAEVARAADEIPGVSRFGERSPAEVMELLGGASFLVVPSECFETFGRVVIEAMARGTAVLASRVGALEELVDHGRTGRLFRSSAPMELAEAMLWMISEPARALEMGKQARGEYEDKYTAKANLALLEEIYLAAIRKTRSGLP